jgi:RecA/RadA recombinase
MSLLEKLKSAGSIKSEVVSESAFFKPKEVTMTTVPIINAAFTGSLDGGLISGLTVIAGPSKHFKTNLALICVQAYMKKYPESVCIFYDSEFGVTPEYLVAHQIDCDRVIHIPVAHIEQLKFDIVKKLEEIGKKDRVIILVDSLGNLASKKEVEDAENEKSVSDMTRAKAIKSLFRIITPHLTMKNIPALVINHTYETQELYSKSVVSGGTGVYYSANQIFIIGRSQEKDGTDLTGYKFTINIEKSRFVKEKSKLAFVVDFDEGINRFSGLLELSLESGHVKKPSNGWYSRVDTTTGEIEEKKYREADTSCVEFWAPILTDQKFTNFVKNKYQLAVGSMMQEKEDE